MKPIQAVERAFTVLEALSREGAMTLGEINKRCSVNKASLLRLLFTMTEIGYIRRDDTNGRYSLTMKPYEIAVGSVHNLDYTSLIHEALSEVSRETNCIAQFSVEEGNDLLCLQSAGHSSSFYSIYTEGGRRSPLYCTSAGKALLATYDNAQIVDRWDSLEAKRLTEHTIVNLQDLLRDLSEIRQRQYARDIEENEYGVFCLGTVIRGASSEVIGALSVTSNKLDEEDERRIAAVLLPAARKLSRNLGCLNPALID